MNIGLKYPGLTINKYQERICTMGKEKRSRRSGVSLFYNNSFLSINFGDLAEIQILFITLILMIVEPCPPRSPLQCTRVRSYHRRLHFYIELFHIIRFIYIIK